MSSTSKEGSGNVFFDLGLEDSTEEYVRGLMAIALVKVLKKKALKNPEIAIEVADALELDPSEVSNWVGNLITSGNLPIECLIRLIHRAGGVLNVTIDVHDEQQEPPMHLTITD